MTSKNPSERIQWHVDHLVQEYNEHGKTAAEIMFKDLILKHRLTIAQSSALAQLFQEAVGSTKRRRNPAPRLGTSRPRRASQITKKAPTKRLVARRKANTAPGYFPNPVMGEVDPRIAAGGLIRQTILRVRKETTPSFKQAALSYAQGITDFARKINAISAAEHKDYIAQLRDAAGI